MRTGTDGGATSRVEPIGKANVGFLTLAKSLTARLTIPCWTVTCFGWT